MKTDIGNESFSSWNDVTPIRTGKPSVDALVSTTTSLAVNNNSPCTGDVSNTSMDTPRTSRRKKSPMLRQLSKPDIVLKFYKENKDTVNQCFDAYKPAPQVMFHGVSFAF